MRFYFPALLALAVAAMIEARSTDPGLRPASRFGDRLFMVLGRGAFGLWLALLGWGFWQLNWWGPLAGVIGSLAVSASFAWTLALVASVCAAAGAGCVPSASTVSAAARASSVCAAPVAE